MDSIKPLSIVCCSYTDSKNWQWLAPRMDENIFWKFFSFSRKKKPSRFLPLNNLKVYFRFARFLLYQKPDLIVSHDPTISAYCALFCRWLGVSVPHLAFSFNFTRLPKGIKHKVMKKAFAGVETFTVFSSMEKKLYHKSFDIPLEKVDVLRWGVNPPEVLSFEKSLVEGRYICALGGNSRDYASLLQVMRALPEVHLVLVVRPNNIRDEEIPSNVSFFQNIPLGEAMNILKFSEFMVLPLSGSEVPCGHVTLVHAMFLGKGFIITDSSGVDDYVVEGENALTYEAFNVEDLKKQILILWNDPERAVQLGENGRKFASQYCTEDHTLEYFEKYLLRLKS